METFVGSTLFRTGDDNLYLILRSVKENALMKKDGTIKTSAFSAWKDYLGADKVLKTNTHFLFCTLIQEAVIVEDEDLITVIPETTETNINA